MSETLITSEVDFAAEGKQTGYLRVPHSVHRSAYGWIPIPIVVIQNGDGPTVLLTAGIHGDEYEGQIALGKLIREHEPEDITGRLIILTMANYPAAEAGTRNSPIDSGNLNRMFPGDRLGTPTEMIAHYIEEELMPLSDFFFDFHSGGSSLMYPSTLLRGLGHSEDESKMLLSLQQAFDAPYAWVFQSGGGPNTTARTALGAAGRKGVIGVMAELGGGGEVSKEILAQTERGIKRMLHHVGVLPGYVPDKANGTRELKISSSAYAYDIGLFEPFFEIGNEVAKGDRAGAIHFPDEPWRGPEPVKFDSSGVVLCRRVPGKVVRGDCLFQIGSDFE